MPATTASRPRICPVHNSLRACYCSCHIVHTPSANGGGSGVVQCMLWFTCSSINIICSSSHSKAAPAWHGLVAAYVETCRSGWIHKAPATQDACRQATLHTISFEPFARNSQKIARKEHVLLRLAGCIVLATGPSLAHQPSCMHTNCCWAHTLPHTLVRL